MRALASLALVAALSSPALADAGDVVYVKDGALVRAPVLVKGEAVALATLPPALAKPDRIAVSPDGRTLVVSAAQTQRWLDLEATTPALRALVCAGPVTLGARAACDSGTGYTLISDLPGRAHRVIDGNPDGARVIGDALYAAGGGALWKIDLASGARTRVAAHVPAHHLSFAPDGSRAVGVYGSGKDAAIYSFRLDGKAVRRKLSRDAEPLAWSADSQWLLVQQGKRACIVRAVGGQYKCWKRYRAVAIAPDGSWALVSRPADGDDDKVDLYRAELEGPDAKRPTPVARAVAPAGAWLREQ